jgi:CheY-like chemotaxis protein
MRSDATLSILHVGDEALGDLVRVYLERDDALDCTVTTTPGDALDRLHDDDTDFDCIVSDYRMPKTNGIEFL